MPRQENEEGLKKAARYSRDTVMHVGTTVNQLPKFTEREINQASSEYLPVEGGSEEVLPRIHPMIEAARRRREQRLMRDLR